MNLNYKDNAMDITILNVPFNEKQKAKNLGALWNNDIKRWYVPSHLNLEAFAKWAPQTSEPTATVNIQPSYYLVESHARCWKCKAVTKVYSFACTGLQDIDWSRPHRGFYVLDYITTLPHELAQCIGHHKPYFKDYSKTTNSWYVMNHCEHCMAQQGDHFMHREPGNPFTPLEAQDCGHIKLIKLNHVDSLLSLDCGFHTDSEDGVIRHHAEALAFDTWRRSSNQDIREN